MQGIFALLLQCSDKFMLSLFDRLNADGAHSTNLCVRPHVRLSAKKKTKKKRELHLSLINCFVLATIFAHVRRHEYVRMYTRTYLRMYVYYGCMSCYHCLIGVRVTRECFVSLYAGDVHLFLSL